MNRPRHDAAGFSLLEVLVTVALVGVSLTVLSGIQRTQMRSLAKLRAHAEARLLLEQAVERFQYGDGLAADSLIAGEYAEYRLAFADLAESAEEGAQPVTLPGDPEAEQLFLLNVPEFGRRSVAIVWDDRGAEQQLAIEAWRFQPADTLAPTEGNAQ